MASIIKVDGYDLFPFTRVAVGDGLDLVDGTFREPTFTDNAAGVGSDLLAVKENNRTFTVPVYLSPKWDTSFALTKDGLNLLVEKVQRLLDNAQQLEWRDEGATNSTFYDIRFAHFEPDYNYRLSQIFVAQGRVILTTRPFGHTGSDRALATVVATGVSGVYIPTQLVGDTRALPYLVLKSGTYLPVEGRITGVSVVPSGYAYDRSASQLIIDGLGSIDNTNAFAADSTEVVAGGEIKSYYSPASMYIGRHRVLAVTRAAANYQYDLFDHLGNTVNQACVASSRAGYGITDLGVIDWRPSPGQGTVGLVIRPSGSAGSQDFVKTGQTFTLGDQAWVNRILLMPEDSTVLSVDVDRRILGYEGFVTRSSNSTIDQLGNTYGQAAGASFAQFSDGRGVPTTVQLYTAQEHILHNPDQNLAVEIQVKNIGVMTAASGAVAVGKYDGGSGRRFAELCKATPASAWTLSIGNQGLSGFGNAVYVATQQVTLTGSYVILEYRQKYNQVHAGIRTQNGSYLATMVASVGWTTNVDNLPGYAHYGINATGGLTTRITGFRVAVVNDRQLLPQDQITFDGYNDRILRSNASGTFNRDVSDSQRGNIPGIDPALNQEFVFWNLPFSGERANETFTCDIRVREQFSYAR